MLSRLISVQGSSIAPSLMMFPDALLQGQQMVRRPDSQASVTVGMQIAVGAKGYMNLLAAIRREVEPTAD